MYNHTIVSYTWDEQLRIQKILYELGEKFLVFEPKDKNFPGLVTVNSDKDFKVFSRLLEESAINFDFEKTTKTHLSC